MSSYKDVQVGDPLSEQEQRAWDLAQQGLTDQEIADQMGIQYSGNAGNHRRRAMRKLGLGDQIRNAGPTSQAGTRPAQPRIPAVRGTRIPTLEDREAEMLDEFEQIQNSVNMLQERLDTLTAEREMDDDAIIAERVADLTAVVEAAQKALDDFEALEDEKKAEYAASFRNQAVARYDREAAELESGLKAATEALEFQEFELERFQEFKARKAAEAAEELGIDPDAVNGDESDEDETPEDAEDENPAS